MKGFVFIGRGGQGAKTAAALLAESLFNQGLEIQAFPEYGPERMGAPVKSYVKASTNKIRSFSAINKPDYIIIIDNTLMKIALPLIAPNTILIINDVCEASKYNEKYNIKNKVITIDATKISLDTIGLNKPNVPLIGALTKIESIIKIKTLTKTINEFFIEKGKKELGKTNQDAVKKAYDEVKL